MASLRLNLLPGNSLVGRLLCSCSFIFQTKMFQMYENISWPKIQDNPSMLCLFICVPCTAMQFTCTDCNDVHPHANKTEAYALVSFPRKGICHVCFHPRSVLCRCVRNESSLLPSEICPLQVCEKPNLPVKHYTNRSERSSLLHSEVPPK